MTLKELIDAYIEIIKGANDKATVERFYGATRTTLASHPQDDGAERQDGTAVAQVLMVEAIMSEYSRRHPGGAGILEDATSTSQEAMENYDQDRWDK